MTLGRDVVHGGNPERHFRLDPFRQLGEDTRALCWFQLGQNQGDGLRVLVGDEWSDLFGRDVLEHVEPRCYRAGYAIENLLRAAGPHSALEGRASEVDAALTEPSPSQEMLFEFFQNRVLQLDGEVLELGDGLGEVFDLVVREVFHHLTGAFLTEGDHQDCCLFLRVEFLLLRPELLSEVVDLEGQGHQGDRRHKGRERILRVTTNTPVPRRRGEEDTLVEESTIIMDHGAIARGQCESALETILREGGRRLLQEALELEVEQYIERFQQLKSESGQGLVVRNGYHQERELVIGAGKVPVRQPRVHDRRPTEHFTSAILPPYLRRTPSIDALIPALYLKGVSTSAFPEALQAILGDGVVGLSAHNVVRLKQVWEQEFQAWSKRGLHGKRYVYLWGRRRLLQCAPAERSPLRAGRGRRHRGRPQGAVGNPARRARKPSQLAAPAAGPEGSRPKRALLPGRRRRRVRFLEGSGGGVAWCPRPAVLGA